MSEVPEETVFLGEFGSRGEEGGASGGRSRGHRAVRLRDTDQESLDSHPQWHREKHQGSELNSYPTLMCDNGKATSPLWDLNRLTHEVLSSLERVERV